MTNNWASDEQKSAKEERKAAFLVAMRGTNGVPLSVRAACAVIGATRSTIRVWRHEDPAFEDAYQEAMEDGTDLLEDTAVSRAVNGVEEPVFMKDADGEPGIVGYKTKYSDDLLKFTLAGRRPERYRSGGDVNVSMNNVVAPADDAQIARALALLLAQAKSKQIVSG